MDHITYVSSTPFDLETLGDHRGYIMDINLGQFFNETETVEEIRKDRIDEERFGQDSCTTNDDDRGGTGTRDPRTEKLIQSGL